MWGSNVVVALCLASSLLMGAGKVLAECAATSVVIETEGCLDIGSEMVAKIRLRGATEAIMAGQFHLEYDASTFTVLSVSAGEPPFTFLVFADSETAGRIDCGSSVFPGPGLPGTSEDRDMITIRFLVDDDGGHPFVAFRLRTFGSLTPSTQLVTVDQQSFSPLTVDAAPAPTADLRDAADFLNCFGGQDEPETTECRCLFDTDGDADVDQTDYEALFANLSSPTGADAWACE